MSQKIYIITKEKYSGHQRTLGFFRFLNNDLYYDFGLLNGSHNSYHRDGSHWRTSLVTRNKPIKEGEHFPLNNFKGLFNLGTVCISKRIITKLPKVKKKYFKKCLVYEIKTNEYPSNDLNIVCELVEPAFSLDGSENSYPPDATVKIFKEVTPWVILTILGHQHNLLAIPKSYKTEVKHFNERFTLNKKGNSYSSESYSGKVFEEYSKEN